MTVREIREIDKKRSYSIRKKNELVRSAKYDLTLQELKFLSYIFSKVSSRDTELQTYSISISEYCKIAGIDCDSGGIYYSKVKASIKKLADKSFWVYDSKQKGEVLERWIEEPVVKDDKTIQVKLSSFIQKYVINVKRNFTDYPFFMILPMRSGYGIRIYELLKSYYNSNSERKTQVITFNLEELKHLLFGKDANKQWIIKYPNFTDFKNNVLKYAEREINLYTDFNIDKYEEIYQGRKVTELKFTVTTKEPDELRKAINACWQALDKNSNNVI